MTLTVGPEAKKFHVHEAAFEESIVFRKLCKECEVIINDVKQIYLKNEAPENIDRVIKYVYMKQVTIKSTTTAAKIGELCETYGVAERYQFYALEILVIEHLNGLRDIHTSLQALFQHAETVYSKLQPNNNLFRLFFRTVAVKCFQLGIWDNFSIATFLTKGGPFALDIFFAHMEALKKSTQEVRAAVKDKDRAKYDLHRERYQHGVTKDELSKMTNKKVAMETDHKLNHTRCRACERDVVRA